MTFKDETESKVMTDEELADEAVPINMPTNTNPHHLTEVHGKYESMCVRFGMLLERYQRVKSERDARGLHIAKLNQEKAAMKKLIPDNKPESE